MTWQKGKSGNPRGRPPVGETIIQKFRDDPRSQEVIDKVLQVASTLGSDDEHPHAFDAAKLVTSRLLPSIRVQEISFDEGKPLGPVILPAVKPLPSSAGSIAASVIQSESIHG